MSDLVELLRAPFGRLRRARAERKAWEMSALADALKKSGLGDRTSPTAAEVRAQANAWKRRARK